MSSSVALIAAVVGFALLLVLVVFLAARSEALRRHDFDVTAFVWGVLFLLVAAYTALRNIVYLPVDLKWTLPAALVAMGIIGIVNALKGTRR